MVAISQYYANVGVAVDNKALKDVDKFLQSIENKLKKGTSRGNLKVNLYVDEAKFNKHLQGVLNRAGKAMPFKLGNLTIDAGKLTASIRDVFARAQFKAPISATISRASLQTIRSQVQAALQGISIGVRVGGVGGRGAGVGGRGAESARRAASLTGRGDPSMQEFLMGRPDKSSLSAGNRRYLDAITGRAFGGVGGSSITGMAVQGGLGGLARMGGSSMLGRLAGMAGMSAGGPMGGALALVGGGLVSGATTLATSIWSTLGTVITAPFKLISGAASMVTGAFYRLALAAVPLVAGFGFINRKVQEGAQQQLALNTVSKSLGSDGTTERNWLMDMSNRDGLRFDTLAQPYTSFIASASPAMGLDMAKNVFESFTQFGMTRGAGDVSMGLAMRAVSQMAGKGKIQAEEMRGQLGDAPGFGEMQGIFAEAYQRSLGKTGPTAPKGQKAIEELNKAMEKGNVLSAKVLPYVAEIAKQMAAGGLDEGRLTSFAEQNRFQNQLSDGWKGFREGGGEAGVAFFWKMMQRMGQWWISNGNSIGAAFEVSMYWLDAFRLGVYEFFQFAKTGESNSFVEWISGFGINLQALRVEILKILGGIGDIFGFGAGSATDTLKTKIQNFSLRLTEILATVADMIYGIAKFMNGAKALNSRNWYEGYALLNPFSKASQEMRTVGAGIVQATGGAKDATIGAGKMLTDIPGMSTPNRTEYGMQGNAKLGFDRSDWNKITAAEYQTTRRSSFGQPMPQASGQTNYEAPQQPRAPYIDPRRTDYADAVKQAQETTQNVNVNVKLEVDGNAEVLNQMWDQRASEKFNVMLTQEITKAVVGAPKRD